MNTIYKYDLNITDRQILQLPVDAQILSIQQQNTTPVYGADGRPVLNNTLQLWALVDPDAALEQRHFIIVGTGNPMPDGAAGYHLATVVTAGGALVWHIFEEVANGPID